VAVVGPDVTAGQIPQVVVEPGVWQSARPLGRYALVGATVVPAFVLPGFELRFAPP
jgi:predicted cupin superfamily sugar epimerase